MTFIKFSYHTVSCLYIPFFLKNKIIILEQWTALYMTTSTPSVPFSKPLGPRVLWNVLFSLECTNSSPMALHLLKQLFPQVECRHCCWWSVTKSCVTFATPWTAACQAYSLSFTISQNLPKLKSIESMRSSNHLILCHPLLLPSILPSIKVFSNSQFFASCGQIIAAAASASVLPMNILRVDFL